MNLIFPFKNITTNKLFDFIEDKENIADFILTDKNEYPYTDNYFLQRVEIYKNSLADFENEILQIINTTSQQTIDYFFTELFGDLENLHDISTPEAIEKRIEDWNKISLEAYNEKIEKETENYFKNEDRKKAHLEVYEVDVVNWLGRFGMYGNLPVKKEKKINYNFFCVESELEFIETLFFQKYLKFIDDLKDSYFDVIRRYAIPYENGKVKSKLGEIVYSKPVVFVEGEHDITYIYKAAQLLNKEDILNNIELRQRGGCSNLDKIWNIYKDNSWETIPQKKLLLYDCDTKKKNEETGDVFKRIIETVPENFISKGIENIFPNSLIEKAIQEKNAFVDITKIHRTKRGIVTEEIIYAVNEDEKKNLCEWICANATKEDFRFFNTVFNTIDIVL